MPLIFVAVGVATLYFAVSLLVNQTVITVDQQELVQRHGPLPWPGNQQLTAAQLKQFYVKKQENRSKEGRVHITYDLWVESEQKGPFRLVGGFDQPEDAVFLEQLLEDRLKIVDRPTVGEIPR